MVTVAISAQVLAILAQVSTHVPRSTCYIVSTIMIGGLRYVYYFLLLGIGYIAFYYLFRWLTLLNNQFSCDEPAAPWSLLETVTHETQ